MRKGDRETGQMMSTFGICEMCGHHVAIRQKAHICAEGDKSNSNILLLCPSCHLMFDTYLKPKIYKALSLSGVQGLPESWTTSIYEQAAKASALKISEKTYITTQWLADLWQQGRSGRQLSRSSARQ